MQRACVVKITLWYPEPTYFLAVTEINGAHAHGVL